MSPPSAISIRDVGKRYVKYEDAPMLVSRVLALRARTRRSRLWAVREANIEVARGECVGIVGRNGSGKSTLLRMLAGVTAPTEGTVAVRGRVAPLISVGVGFHAELTGRENVYVNGTVLGLSRQEIDRRFDEIVEFAEIEDFIDTPVKFYSSGMFVRLGFAVAVTAQPEVLLVDEVLAVGDLAFQTKCFQRMMEIKERGTTIVVVSHNLNAIRWMCQRCLVVHDGQVRYDGSTDGALSVYHELLSAGRSLDLATLETEMAGVDDAARLDRVELVGADGSPTAHVREGESVVFQAEVQFDRAVVDPMVNFNLISESGVLMYATARTIEGRFEAGQRTSIRVAVRVILSTGSYSANVSLLSNDWSSHLASPPKPLHFYVSGAIGVNGLVNLGAELSIDQTGPDLASHLALSDSDAGTE